MTDLKTELRAFTGSNCFFKHPLFVSYRYTEGVQYLARQAEAYWLIEYIFGQQVQGLIKLDFQVWTLELQKDNAISISVQDDEGNIVAHYNFEYTNFPLEELTLWFIDGTLLLPGEY